MVAPVTLLQSSASSQVCLCLTFERLLPLVAWDATGSSSLISTVNLGISPANMADGSAASLEVKPSSLSLLEDVHH